MKTFEFFFYDFSSSEKAPDAFATAVLTSLKSSLYRPNEIIIPYKQRVDELVIIDRGYCNLYGF